MICKDYESSLFNLFLDLHELVGVSGWDKLIHCESTLPSSLILHRLGTNLDPQLLPYVIVKTQAFNKHFLVQRISSSIVMLYIKIVHGSLKQWGMYYIDLGQRVSIWILSNFFLFLGSKNQCDHLRNELILFSFRFISRVVLD